MRKMILFVCALGMASVLHAQSSRLSAHATLYGDYTYYGVPDSVIYTYSGLRGGDLTHTLKYDTSFGYSNMFGTGLALTTKLFQTFDASNNILTTTQLAWIDSAWANSEFNTYTYDVHGNMLTNLFQTWDDTSSSWQNYDNIIYTYDAAGNQLSYTIQVFESGAWVNNTKYVYTYDASNNQLTNLYLTWNTTSASWDSNNVVTNTYTPANKIATATSQIWSSTISSWINGLQTQYDYNTANNLTEYVDFFWMDSAWQVSDRDTNTYDGSGHLLSTLTEGWGFTSMVWGAPSSGVFYSDYTAAGQPQIIITQSTYSSDTLQNFGKDSVVYNSAGQETADYGTNWWDGAWMILDGSTGDRYYYETYTTSVQNIVNTNCTTNVYPVPAKDVLHVSVTWDEAQPFTMQLMDMEGRVIGVWNVPAEKTYYGNINTGNLSAGNYLLKINGANGQSVNRVVIGK